MKIKPEIIEHLSVVLALLGVVLEALVAVVVEVELELEAAAEALDLDIVEEEDLLHLNHLTTM